MNDYAPEIAAGIKLLDEQKPDWRSLIDVDTLQLSSCDVCVLGQIFGDYTDGLTELGITDGKAYGFDTSYSFQDLTQAWKDALGKDNTLVEQGDVWQDEYKCCTYQIAATKIVEVDGNQVTVYIARSGSIVNGEFAAYKDALMDVCIRSDFGDGGKLPHKWVPFTFKKGQFVTNDTGTVYYVSSSGATAREVKDGGAVVWTHEISRTGLREVTTKNGALFSDTIK